MASQPRHSHTRPATAQCIITPDAKTPVNLTGPFPQGSQRQRTRFSRVSASKARSSGFEGLAAKVTDRANFYFERTPPLPKFVHG